MHVASTIPRNTQPGLLTRHRVAGALAAAIHRTCDARGDDAHNRAALLEACATLRPEQQVDLLGHFTVEAARWESANRGGRL